MRSPYFHKFTPNILGDAWFWFVIVVALAMVAFGYCQRYLKKGARPYLVRVIELNGYEHVIKRVPRIKNRLRHWVVNAVFGVLLVVFTILLVKGSGDGILQFFDNGLVGNESPFWSIPLAGGAIVVIDLAVAVIWIVMFVWGGSLKDKKLKNDIKAMPCDEGPIKVVDKRAV